MGTPDSVGEYIEVVTVVTEVRRVSSAGTAGGLSKAAMMERSAPSPLVPPRTVPSLETELERERLAVETDDFLDRDDRSENGLCWPALKKGLLPVLVSELLPPVLRREAALSRKGFCDCDAIEETFGRSVVGPSIMTTSADSQRCCAESVGRGV